MPKIIEFEGVRHEFPDDFTDEEVRTSLAKISKPSGQKQTSATSTSEKPKDTTGSVVLDAVGGVGSSVLGIPVHAYELIRNYVPGAKEHLPETNAFWKGVATPPDSTAGKVGNFAGDVAQFALGSGEVNAALKAAELTKAAKLVAGGMDAAKAAEMAKTALLTKMAAQGAANAGMSAVKTGGDPVATAIGAVSGAGGEAVGAALGNIKLRNPNAKVAAAVQEGLDNGIPVDAGTATGNAAVKGIQHLADRSIGGSVVNTGADQETAQALASRGRDIAGKVYPSAVSPYDAGKALKQGVEASKEASASKATEAYRALEKIQADPAVLEDAHVGWKQNMSTDPSAPDLVPDIQKIPMPVDLRPVKEAMAKLEGPLSDRMTPAQQDLNPALNAIRNILKRPDAVPASVADKDLGYLKGILRNKSASDQVKHFAGEAIDALEAQVQDAVAKAGPEATKALSAGRAATIDKYAADEVLKSLHEDPVKIFEQSIFRKDAGVDQLRAIQKFAPQEIAKVGRAYVDDLIHTATSEGSFSKGAKLWSAWDNLGPQTKQIIFNPRQAEDLDKFFLLAKKMGENPNPSGTGHLVSLGAQAGGLIVNPASGIPIEISGALLSKFLHSPKGVNLLINGMKTAPSMTGPAAALSAAISEMANAKDKP